MSNMREEIRQLTAEFETAGRPITAESFVEAAKNKAKLPNLHRHVWERSEGELAQIARVALMHQLMITVRIVTNEGQTTRLLLHTSGTKGYTPATTVARTVDLAAIKLRALTEDINRARQRMNEFKALLSDEVSAEIDDSLARAEQVITRVIEDRTVQAAA